MSAPHELETSSFPALFLLQSNSTYEASREGTLGRVVYELHVAEWGLELKTTMEHITYQPEYDRFDKSDIFVFFGIDESSVQFLEAFDPAVQQGWKNGTISDVDILAHVLRRIFFRLRSHTCTDYEDGDALNVISILFEACTITTIAVPKDCAAARGTQWFASRSPDVDQSLRFDYKVGGKDFVLFGSEEMVGDRDWDRE